MLVLALARKQTASALSCHHPCWAESWSLINAIELCNGPISTGFSSLLDPSPLSWGTKAIPPTFFFFSCVPTWLKLSSDSGRWHERKKGSYSSIHPFSKHLGYFVQGCQTQGSWRGTLSPDDGYRQECGSLGYWVTKTCTKKKVCTEEGMARHVVRAGFPRKSPLSLVSMDE